MDERTLDRLTNETVELLQALIRNECVNDGTPDSAQEERSARLLRDRLESTGVDLQTFTPIPGRGSLIARWPGTDPDAPALCLMGHTDVVPVSADGWDVDPFAGELIGNEVWGRGAVDMLNLTSSMAVAFEHMVTSGRRYRGDIIYFAVADEEAGGRYGAEILLDKQWDALACDYVLTEFGGIPLNSDAGTTLLVTTAEKGVGWVRIKVGGTPGHGSRPYGADNALIKAAEIVRRLVEYRPNPLLDDMFKARVEALGLDDDLSAALLDPVALSETLTQLPVDMARDLHGCSHTTFSPNTISGGVKANVIPDKVTLEVDIRTLPGEDSEDIHQHLRNALGEMYDQLDIEFIQCQASTASPTDNKLWEALTSSMADSYPQAQIIPSLVTGGTDSRFFRAKGAVAYGAGLLGPEVDSYEFARRFHGHNERIDIESLRLTTKLWLDVVERLWD